MTTKILYFKFTKKNLESNERNCKSKKNYANIFNNILNGEKNDKVSDNKNGTIERKKNKIKCISKINTLNYQGGIGSTILNIKKDKKNNGDNKKMNLSNNISTEFKKNEGDEKEEKNLDKKVKNNPINEYIKQSNQEKYKNLKIDLTKPFNLDKNNMDKRIDSHNNRKKSAKKNKKKESALKNKKENNFIKQSKKKIESELSFNKREKNKNRNKPKININKYELSQNENNSINANKTYMKNKNRLAIKNNIKYKKINNNKNCNKRLSSYEPKNIVFKNSKKNQFNNYLNKITITNDNINESAKLKKNKNSFNYTLNNDAKSKKLILNNTNSNINININITNINDKNIRKKENDSDKKSKKSNVNSENNNYNNNITTVNIINNNSNIKKKLNDYRLLFYNHSKKEKYSPYLNKINSKGIEIQSININLGEEANDEFNKMKLKKNLTEKSSDGNSNYFKKKEIENEKKEAQSEYEHFRDLEDFWSNRSQTSFSCKSGFTASRKLRSLSRERDKIKLLNNCQKKNEQEMEKIGDKLLNIVNNFHNNSGIYDMKKNRKSINGIRKKYKMHKNYKTTIGEEKKFKSKKNKYL